MIRTILFLMLAAAGVSTAFPPKTKVTPTAATGPTVVELFQSQGCSSCPPANANLNAIADRPDVLALSFAVTYWDQLGWKDTFGSPRWTARQWDYAHRAGRAQVATPQVIVNGSIAIVGSNARELDATIARAGPPRGGPGLAIEGNQLRIGSGVATQPSIVWLVRYDPHVRSVPIRVGENGGRTLPHRDIVRDLLRLGDWSGHSASLAIPAAHEPGLSSAILVQQGIGGPIIAARRI